MFKKYLVYERFNGPWLKTENAGTRCIWLHGASLGECKVLVNVARRLLQNLPCVKLLITTQKAEIIETLRRSVASTGIAVAIAPAPFKQALLRFYEQVKPQVLVLCENELWPGYLKLAEQKNFNVALISGRFKSAAPFARLYTIKYATFQTENDEARFNKFCGSVKFNTGCYCNWKLLSAGNNTPYTEKNFDIGFLSVHFSEWNGIAPLVKEYSERGESVLLAPRRLEEVPLFENAVAGFSNARNITILKKFGVLPEYILQCKNAVMGGSFVRRPGIHNFLEPLLLGVPTFVGPFATGEREFVNSLLENKILTRVPYGVKSLPTPLANSQQITKFLEDEITKVERSYAVFAEHLQQWIEQ